MQDTYTGAMVPLEANTQAAKDAALPRDRQGAVLAMGELVEIKGGFFRVASIRNKRIVLKGVSQAQGLEEKNRQELASLGKFKDALEKEERQTILERLREEGGL